MANNKTTGTALSVNGFLQALADEVKRKDCYALIELMQKQTGLEPKMWVPASWASAGTITSTKVDIKTDAPWVAFSPWTSRNSSTRIKNRIIYNQM